MLLSVCLLVAACSKNKDTPMRQLPSLTTEGKNVMGCYINDELQIFEGEYFTFSEWGVKFTYDEASEKSSLRGGPKNADAQSGLDGDIYLEVYTPMLKADTVYRSFLPSLFGVYEIGGKDYHVEPDDDFNFIAFARIDSEVAAGLFQFRAYSNSGDSVYITHGRFDIAR